MYKSTDMRELKCKKKFKNFVAYLFKGYLSEGAKYPHTIWNYHEALSESDFCITTNSLENVNHHLKAKVGTGYLSRPFCPIISVYLYNYVLFVHI